MDKHTPTPWITSGWSSNGTPISGNGEIIAKVFTPNWNERYGFSEPKPRSVETAVSEAKANAEYIVLCVNSHRDLVEAAEIALKGGSWDFLREALAKAKGDGI